MDRSGHIYIIELDIGYCKIGRTRNIPARMNFFGVKLPFEFKVLNTFQVDDMFYFEAWLHDWFREDRVNGEWFMFDRLTKKILTDFEDQDELEDFIAFTSLR